MLYSMVRSPAPTRAEASDVATAIYDGADAVMLSAESAVGSYPVEAVAMMNRIIERTERDSSYRAIIEALDPEPEPNAADAISEAAGQVATTLSAAAIVTSTTRGSTGPRAGRPRARHPGRDHESRRCDRHLDDHRLDGPASRAPAPPRSHPAPDLGAQYRPPLRSPLGRPLRPYGRCSFSWRNGGKSHDHRPPGKLRQLGLQAGHHRWRALRHPRRHQRAADCLGGVTAPNRSGRPRCGRARSASRRQSRRRQAR